MRTWWERNKTDMKILLIVVIVCGGLFKFVDNFTKYQYERSQVVCPSYLSITRSFRDTLIVMKNDKGCAEYVLTHFK